MLFTVARNSNSEMNGKKKYVKRIENQREFIGSWLRFEIKAPRQERMKLFLLNCLYKSICNFATCINKEFIFAFANTYTRNVKIVILSQVSCVSTI